MGEQEGEVRAQVRSTRQEGILRMEVGGTPARCLCYNSEFFSLDEDGNQKA